MGSEPHQDVMNAALRLPRHPSAIRLTAGTVATALRKSWLLSLAICTAVSAATAFWVLGETKIYQATATLRVDPTAPKPLGQQVQNVVETGAGTFWANREYYQTQFRILQSQAVARGTVEALGLHNDMAFLTNTPSGAPLPSDATATDIETASTILRSRVSIQPVRETRLVEVRLDDSDPARARRVLQTVVDVYMQQNIDYVLESTSSAADWLRGQLDKLKTELDDTEIALHNYKMDKQILSVSLADQSNMLRAEMGQLNERLTEVRAKIQEISSRNSVLAKLATEDPTAVGADELLRSNLLRTLRQEYVTAKKEEQSLLGGGKGANHPEVRAVSARVATARDAMLAEIRNVQDSVARQLVAAEREAGGLANLFGQAKKRALELNLLEIEYRRLERTKDNTEKLYSLVLERTKESDLTRVMRFNNVRLIDPPIEPKVAIKPRVTLTISLGLAGGLALGFLFAVGRELLDRTVKTPEDLEAVTGLAFLGLLPAATGGAPYGGSRESKTSRAKDVPPELVVHSMPKSGIAEAARAIRTNVLFMSPDSPFKRILVTSAGPSEGKTTVACALAISMAQAGQRVVLVDCDLRKPRVHKILARSNDVGVTSAMLDPESLDWGALATEIPGLSALASGPHVPNPAEVLQSDRFGQLIDRLEERFDRVVIDSPPLVPVTDAAIVSRRADATILVVRALATTKDLARQATRILYDVNARIAGTVLNALDLGNRKYGYSGYYYYHREGYGEEPKP